MATLKQCSKCGEGKPLSAYYLGSNKRPMPSCKDCWKAQVIKRRRENPAVQAYDRERAKTPKGREKNARVSKSWRARNPVAYRAQNKVNNALRDGKIERGPCEVCGSTVRVHAHHDDYSKPLEVRWLCPLHHHRGHADDPEMRGHQDG